MKPFHVFVVALLLVGVTAQSFAVWTLDAGIIASWVGTTAVFGGALVWLHREDR